MRVTYGQSVHGEEEIAAVVEVLRSSTQMGARVREMERQVADLFSKRFGVMVNSGSSALELAVRVADIEPGAEFVTPVLTFATTLAPALRAGWRPIFVDVEPDTYNIDASRIEERITPRTRAMVVPNLIGNLPDWDRLWEIAERRKLLVIEDSADTLGATLRGASTGTRSHISTTSFYGSHIINCAGNGGMVCLNDPEMTRRAILLRSWGRSSSLLQALESERVENRFDVALEGISYDRKFVFEEIGYNFEPSEAGAAFGLVQLKKLAGNIERRRKVFAMHNAFFKRYEKYFILPKQLHDADTGWLAFALTIRDEAPFTRRDLQIHFERNGIQTRPIFTGNVLRQPAFKSLGAGAPDDYPNADRVMRGGMLVGCHHGLTNEQVAHIHDVFLTFI